MPDQAVYRCIEPSCARSMPRRVNFCPYCGLAQHAGSVRPNSQRVGSGFEEAAGASTVGADETSAGPVRAVAGEVGTNGRGQAAVTGSPGRKRLPPTPGAPSVPVASRPPERQPIRLRWWLLALAFLWMVWVAAKHSSTQKIDARIDRAVALAEQCKSREAQSELAALRSNGVAPGKLQRLQQALDEAVGECRRNRRRGKSTADAGDARAIDGVARPRARLNRRGAQRGEEQ